MDVGDCSLNERPLEQLVEGCGGNQPPFAGTGARWDGNEGTDGSSVGGSCKVSELLRGGCHCEQAVGKLGS